MHSVPLDTDEYNAVNCQPGCICNSGNPGDRHPSILLFTVGARQINAAENLNKPDAALERQISKLHTKIICNNSWDFLYNNKLFWH